MQFIINSVVYSKYLIGYLNSWTPQRDEKNTYRITFLFNNWVEQKIGQNIKLSHKPSNIIFDVSHLTSP